MADQFNDSIYKGQDYQWLAYRHDLESTRWHFLQFARFQDHPTRLARAYQLLQPFANRQHFLDEFHRLRVSPIALAEDGKDTPLYNFSPLDEPQFTQVEFEWEICRARAEVHFSDPDGEHFSRRFHDEEPECQSVMELAFARGADLGNQYQASCGEDRALRLIDKLHEDTYYEHKILRVRKASRRCGAAELLDRIGELLKCWRTGGYQYGAFDIGPSDCRRQVIFAVCHGIRFAVLRGCNLPYETPFGTAFASR